MEEHFLISYLLDLLWHKNADESDWHKDPRPFIAELDFAFSVLDNY